MVQDDSQIDPGSTQTNVNKMFRKSSEIFSKMYPRSSPKSPRRLPTITNKCQWNVEKSLKLDSPPHEDLKNPPRVFRGCLQRFFSKKRRPGFYEIWGLYMGFIGENNLGDFQFFPNCLLYFWGVLGVYIIPKWLSKVPGHIPILFG